MNWLEMLARRNNEPTYLEQEQVLGKSLCYPTAIVNTTLGLRVISSREALKASRQINQALASNPNLWDFGSPLLLLDFGNEAEVARILEEFLPVKVGGPSDLRACVPYSEMLSDVTSRGRGHAIMVSAISHVYAAVGLGNHLCYVDSNEPRRLFSVRDEEAYRRLFFAGNGFVKTTPVTPLPVKRWYSGLINRSKVNSVPGFD